MLSAAAEGVLAAVHLYVGSAEGRRVIGSALQRRRLPGSFDVEIEEAVLGEALRFLRAGNEIVSVPAWCRARINARAIDMARGVLRRERRLGVRVPFDEGSFLDDAAFDDAGFDDDHADGVQGDAPGWPAEDSLSDDGVAHDRRSLAELRTALLASDASDASVAGALTFVSRVAEDVPPVASCPTPRAGADVEEAAMWVVLWYLGLRDCFGAGNAMAKRRSRAASKIRSVLRKVGEGLR